MRLPELIDDIYLAATEPDLWPEVLDKISFAANAHGSVLLSRRNDAWVGWKVSSSLPTDTDDYIVKYSHLSQATVRLIALDRAGFVGSHEAFVDDEEYRRDAIQAYWGIPNGFHHACATAIHIPNGDLVVAHVQRKNGQPVFDASDRTVLDQMRPHLARAGLLATRWRLQRFRVAAEALAQVGLPTIVVDAQGRVAVANSLAEAGSTYFTWRSRDRIALADENANALFTRAISSLREPSSDVVRSIPLVVGSTPARAVVHVIPTLGIWKEMFDGGYGLVVVTPVDTTERDIDHSLLKGLFDLTSAEARVANAIANGHGLPEIASRGGISYGTARTHVKRILEKMGVGRQSQVAAILARIVDL
jgi:DNA-binding CsgD family transcriptional regulator